MKGGEEERVVEDHGEEDAEDEAVRAFFKAFLASEGQARPGGKMEFDVHRARCAQIASAPQGLMRQREKKIARWNIAGTPGLESTRPEVIETAVVPR